MNRYLLACLLLIGSLVLAPQSMAQTDAKAGVEVGNVASASRQVGADGRTTQVDVDPTKKVNSKVTLKGKVGANVPGLNVPIFQKSVEKTIDLKDVLKNRKNAAKAEPNAKPNSRPSAKVDQKAKPAALEQAITSKTSAEPAPSVAATPASVSPPPTRPAPAPAPQKPSGLLAPEPAELAALAGSSLVATIAAAYALLFPGGLTEVAGQALSHLRPPSIRAEGRMGASEVGPVEFLPQDEAEGDLALPPIGIIVRQGRMTTELSFTDLPSQSQASA